MLYALTAMKKEMSSKALGRQVDQLLPNADASVVPNATLPTQSIERTQNPTTATSAPKTSAGTAINS